jgi:hypothetical protein
MTRFSTSVEAFMQVDFYSEMGDAMAELSEVFLQIGFGPDEVRDVAKLLTLASGLNPVADKARNASGS